MTAISGFRNRLREVLHRRGMSQTELARQLNVRVATVNEWLNRGTMPSGPIMLRLPGILSVDGHWLLTGESVRTGDRPTLTPEEHEQVTALLEQALRTLNHEPADYLRVREPSADERRALESVDAFRREPTGGEPRQRRSQP